MPRRGTVQSRMICSLNSKGFSSNLTIPASVRAVARAGASTPALASCRKDFASIGAGNSLAVAVSSRCKYSGESSGGSAAKIVSYDFAVAAGVCNGSMPAPNQFYILKGSLLLMSKEIHGRRKTRVQEKYRVSKWGFSSLMLSIVLHPKSVLPNDLAGAWPGWHKDAS